MRGRRLLVVDDDAEMRSWLRFGLERLGAVVCEACGGWECLGRLSEEGPFDLVITDMRMPMPSGLSVLASARSIGVATPFILITAFSDPELRTRVAALPDAALVDKPFELEELVEQALSILGEAPAAGGQPPEAIPTEKGTATPHRRSS